MKYLKFLSLFAFAALLFPFQGTAQSSIKLEEVGVVAAKQMVEDGALMVDVRETNEVAALAYDVENIINIPLSELESRLNEIPKDKTLIMVCRSGNRSRRAGNFLLANGYSDLMNMTGGIIGWQENNLNVKK